MNSALLIVAILLAALILWLAAQIFQSQKKGSTLESQLTELRRDLLSIAQTQSQSAGQIQSIGTSVSQRLEAEEHPRANPPASGTNRRRSRTKPRPLHRHAIHREHSRRQQDPRHPRRSHPAAPARRFSSFLAILAAVPLFHGRSRRRRHLPARQKTHGHRLQISPRRLPPHRIRW